MQDNNDPDMQRPGQGLDKQTGLFHQGLVAHPKDSATESHRPIGCLCISIIMILRPTGASLLGRVLIRSSDKHFKSRVLIGRLVPDASRHWLDRRGPCGGLPRRQRS